MGHMSCLRRGLATRKQVLGAEPQVLSGQRFYQAAREPCNSSHHEADHGESHESETRSALGPPKVLCEAAAAAEPPERALHDPALGQHDEAHGCVGALPTISSGRRHEVFTAAAVVAPR